MSNESNNQNAREPAAALAVKLARESAFAHCNEHPYLPQTREQANSWQPHEWVVAAIHTAALIASLPVGHRFQADVADWMDQCFLPSLSNNMTERGDRLLEEVLELLQAHGYDSARVPTLVNYVFGRPVGEPAQEVGGVMVTLAAYCSVAGLSMQADGQAELDRINQPEVMARIRAKQEAKNALHFDTSLPGAAAGKPRTTLLPDDPRIVEKIAAEIEGGKLDHPGFYRNTQLAEALRRMLDAALEARQPAGAAPSIDYEDLLDQAKDLIHCGCSVNGAFEWLLEQLTDGEALAALPAQAMDLAADHCGMRVDYHGLLRQVQDGLRSEPGLAEMVRQLHGHLTELGRRWYAGDRKVVDELLQLYGIEDGARRALIDSKAVGNG